MELLWHLAQMLGWAILAFGVFMSILASIGSRPKPVRRPNSTILRAYREIAEIEDAAISRMLAILWDGGSA
jgi:hypothetical protein